MADYSMDDVRSWADKGGGAKGAAPKAAPPPAAAARDDDGGEEEGSEEAGPVEIITVLQAALDTAVAALSKLDVTDEPAKVTSKLKTLLAEVQDVQESAVDMLEAYEAAHEGDEEEERVLLGDEAAKKKAPPKKGPPGADEEDDEDEDEG